MKIHLASFNRLEPASFTMVMSTGAFALATYDMAELSPVFLLIAKIINTGNFILFGCLVLLAFFSWPAHREKFKEDFIYPQRTAFYAAIGISLLVLGAQAMKFSISGELALFFWVGGCLLTLGINFTIYYHFFIHTPLQLEHFNPIFFIPVGGLAVLPVGGSAIMPYLRGLPYDLVLMINTLALGGGLLLYTGVFSLMLQRHFLKEPLEHTMAPTVWIHMAPIGWSGVSLLALGNALKIDTSTTHFLAAILWGGCCWWFIMSILLTMRSVFSGRMHFTLAYWAFIFPLGAFTVLSHGLGRPFESLFYGLWALMAALWLLAACQTAIHLWDFANNKL